MTTSHIGTDINILDSDLTQVLKDSEEWNILEYFLQMNTRTSRVKLIQAWHMSPTHIINKFEKKHSDKLVLKCFIDTVDLDMENSIQDVCRRGFTISKRGLKLSVGNFSIPGFPLMSMNKKNVGYDENELICESNELSLGKKGKKKILECAETFLLSGERRIFEFFLCDVGVGFSLAVNDNEIAAYTRDTLPMEYDSIFIKKKKDKSLDDTLTIHYRNKEETGNSNINSTGDNSNEINLAFGGDMMASYGILPHYTFHHEYIIYDSSQLLPRYLLQFECNPNEEEHFAVPLCDYCQDAPSSLYCESDQVRLCETCDDVIHSQNKLVMKHTRRALNEAQKILGKCKVHPNTDATMFCTLCHVPVCIFCVSSHVHNNLDDENILNLQKNTTDTLISLNMAYKAILQYSDKSSQMVKEKKKKLKDLLDKTQNLYELVKLNIRDAEDNVYTILEDLIRQLHIMTEKKMCTVLSEEYELKRQFNEIVWNESFLNYLQTILPPADYMNAWLKHCKLREEIEKKSVVVEEMYSLIFPDMRIKGNINILTAGAIQHEDACHSNENK